MPISISETVGLTIAHTPLRLHIRLTVDLKYRQTVTMTMFAF